MVGGSLTANCSAALNQCSSDDLCGFDDASTAFHHNIRGYIWRHDALLLAEEILAMILVGIGAYGQRYRHHPFTRFIFLGATTLFLPIISSVISTVGSYPDYVITSPPNYNYELLQDQSAELSALVAICSAFAHSVTVVAWAFLVQIVMINTSTIVSVDDREGQSKGPPYQLLVQGLWTVYLGFSFFRGDMMVLIFLRLVPPFALLFSKIVLKYYAFEKAQRSYALGHNPGLVYVYMQQLQAQEADQPPVGEEVPPPPLLVMGEDGLQVEEHPHGYAVKGDSGTGPGLVTIDRVWHLDNTLPISTPRLKDLCLSFALFKLLRCRFARYKLTNAGSIGTLTFFRSLLLKVSQHDRVFEVIANELCFIHDYYYSSLPISYSKCYLPFLSTILALLCMGYCILIAMLNIVILIIVEEKKFFYFPEHDSHQIYCRLWCINQHLVSKQSDAQIGRFYYDGVPLLLLLLLVVTAEVRDMASYICSNWTKVALIFCYVNRASSRHSFCMQKWVSLLLRCRCKLLNHWDEKMSQCSVLTLQAGTSPVVLVRRLLCLPDQRRKVKVPAAVKVCIISALRSSFNGGLSNGVESLRRSQVGESFIWACHGKGTSNTILIWHIATNILEVKHPHQHNQGQDCPSVSSSDHKIAATHLSRYCAYLVTWCPELLPDNKAWSKSLYEAVKKDAECALAEHPAPGSSTPEDEYRQLVEVLQANSKNELLKNGVKLGMQLVETIDCEEAIWKLLAEFWSEMILYVAPSDNLKGHSEAIARGGELITLLWAMLFHAGIDSRPGEDDGATATSGGAV